MLSTWCMYGTSSVRTGLLKPTRLHKSHNRLLARILLKELIHHHALCGNIWYFFFLHFCKVTLRVQFKTLILKTKWYDFLYTPLSLPPLSSSTLGTDRTEAVIGEDEEAEANPNSWSEVRLWREHLRLTTGNRSRTSSWAGSAAMTHILKLK